MSRAMRVFVVLILGTLILGLSLSVADLNDPEQPTDVSQNPPRDPGSGDPNDPGGGLCPNPWPVKLTITGYNATSVDVVSGSTADYRSLTQLPGRTFEAVICAEDSIAWEAASTLGPGLTITNNHAQNLHIRWKYSDGSESGIVTIPPGGSDFHSLSGNLSGATLLDPGPEIVTQENLDPV